MIFEFLLNSKIEKKNNVKKIKKSKNCLKFYVNLYCVKKFILNIKYCFLTKTLQNENEIKKFDEINYKNVKQTKKR